MKKKIFALCLIAVLAATAVVGGTLAYFTDTDKKDNTFTVGNVSIVLNEPNWDKTGAAEAIDAYPGEALAKDPTVTNDGKNPCFVRIKVDGLDQFVGKYGEDAVIKYRTDYVQDKISDEWTYNEDDGYFYYNTVLAVGATTDALFDQIVMPVELENDAATTPITVSAEAVQAQGARPNWNDNATNGPGVVSMTVEDIAAWFNTVMGAESTPAESDAPVETTAE